MDLTSQIQNSDKQTNILNRFTLGVMNTLLIFFFLYNLFSKQYLPNSGTGIVFAIISGFAMMYISINVFIGGINKKAIQGITDALLMKLDDTNKQAVISKAKKQYSVYRMLNSAKMGYLSLITTALSVMFFKYNDTINEHHSSIPSFDSFFMFVSFSIMSQVIYLSSLHFNYTETFKKYLDSSYRSLIIFGIINFFNLLFVLSMFSELIFMPTDG